MNEQFGLFSIFLDHLITADKFFHWSTCIKDKIYLFIQSKTVSLILPISVFDELLSLNDGLCGKLSLWSLTVIYASFFCNWSTLSLINSLSAIFSGANSLLLTFELLDFLYV